MKKVRVQTTKKTVTKEMLARKQWAKFGDAQRYKPGDESMTAVSIEEIFLERMRLVPKSESEKSGDALAAMVRVFTGTRGHGVKGSRGRAKHRERSLPTVVGEIKNVLAFAIRGSPRGGAV